MKTALVFAFLRRTHIDLWSPVLHISGEKFVGRKDLIDSVCARTDSLTAIQNAPSTIFGAL
jgi:hypothetical protein